MKGSRFRVWDIEAQRFCISSDIATTADGDILVYKHHGDSKLPWRWVRPMGKEVYVVQYYTGLLDMRNREICEGDYVDGFGQTFLVKWGIVRRTILTEGKEDLNEVDIPSFYFETFGMDRLYPIVKNFKEEHDLKSLQIVGNRLENRELFGR